MNNKSVGKPRRGSNLETNGRKPLKKIPRNNRQWFIERWGALPEEEKTKLLPILIDLTNGWHEWTINSSSCLVWLEGSFEKAGVSFPEQAKIKG